MRLSIFAIWISIFPLSDLSSTPKQTMMSFDKEQIMTDSSGMETLEVPNGFLFRNNTDLELNLNMRDRHGRMLRQCRYEIFILDQHGEKDLISSGMTSPEGKLRMKLKVPLHVDELLIECREKLNPSRQYYYTFYKREVQRLNLKAMTL